MGASAFKTIAVPKGLHALYMTLCLYILTETAFWTNSLSLETTP